ncbi:MAG: hypothetical protein ACTSW1_02515 [Candidatus Hodarchaeales archaeon]
MAQTNTKHEDIIKFIILLDKWRSRPPGYDELRVLSTVGVKLFPDEVKHTNKVANNLTIHPHHHLIEKIHNPVQKISIGFTLFFVFTLVSYLSRSFAWEFAESLIFNPLFVLTIMSSFIINGFIMYQHRRLGLEYRISNKDALLELRKIVENLLEQLSLLAIKGEFEPKKYPFRLKFDDYPGLRLIGKSGRQVHLMFSISHSLFIKHNSVKIMTPMGRLSFFDGLAGFRGGKPEIKMIVGEVAGDLKTYLKKCADWRQQGIDILVRKAKKDQIKRTYIILDDNTIWVSSLILEEFDSSNALDLKKVKEPEEKKKIVKHFSQLWEISQKSDELEALSWRSYFKERAKSKKTD